MNLFDRMKTRGQPNIPQPNPVETEKLDRVPTMLDEVQALMITPTTDDSIIPTNIADLELHPRETLLKMLQECPEMDTPYTFKTLRGGGPDYVQAIRMHLSRAREKARKNSVALREFRLFVIQIISTTNYDEITLVRSNRLSLKQKYAYDALIEYMKCG